MGEAESAGNERVRGLETAQKMVTLGVAVWALVALPVGALMRFRDVEQAQARAGAAVVVLEAKSQEHDGLLREIRADLSWIRRAVERMEKP